MIKQVSGGRIQDYDPTMEATDVSCKAGCTLATVPLDHVNQEKPMERYLTYCCPHEVVVITPMRSVQLNKETRHHVLGKHNRISGRRRPIPWENKVMPPSSL